MCSNKCDLFNISVLKFTRFDSLKVCVAAWVFVATYAAVTRLEYVILFYYCHMNQIKYAGCKTSFIELITSFTLGILAAVFLAQNYHKVPHHANDLRQSTQDLFNQSCSQLDGLSRRDHL
jgi:hypothetical protein